MTLIINAIVTIVLGGLGWIALEFIGRPVRSFFDLRRRIKALMLDCIDIPSIFSDYDGEGQKYNHDKEALKKLANEMIAFGESESLAVLFVKYLGFDPVLAGKSVAMLASQLRIPNEPRAENYEAADEALRFN